ncbi:DUF2939 domain-containing protein [Caulobacter segnis]|uniref:DUF2939 domain-containing protein n=1 Tax=Caulobacter segnis TaxID=88688 RepID=UPI00240F8EF7|nr:DUF2939 domain-containing protein [Caulobacter segnis]MDG2521451.1 DUF2939 domain-containing protein [Caulobacter segnis]
MRQLLVLPLLLAALALSACATVSRVDASNDVHALLIAIRDNDGATFDRHVDKVALKRQLESRIVEQTQRSNAPDPLKALGYMLSRTAADLAGDALLRPTVFRAVAESYGYRPSQPIPGRLAIASALRPIGGGRVCAARSDKGPCLLTFANQGGVWRLVSFDGPVSELKLP